MPTFVKGVPTTLLPSNTYSPAARQSQVFTVPASISSVKVEAWRNSWPVTGVNVITVSVEHSTDGGDTWEPLLTFAAPGGDLPAKGGGILAKSFGTTQLFPGEQVRLTGENFVLLNTQIDVTVN